MVYLRSVLKGFEYTNMTTISYTYDITKLIDSYHFPAAYFPIFLEQTFKIKI